MTIIHMDLEQVLETVRRLTQAYGDMAGEIIELRRAKERLAMGWSGDSSTEFQEELQIWIAACNRQAIRLHELIARLENELAEWEEAGRRLEGPPESNLGAGPAGIPAGLSDASSAGNTARQNRLRGNQTAASTEQPQTRQAGTTPRVVQAEIFRGSVESGKVNAYLQTPRGQHVYGDLPQYVIDQIPAEYLLNSSITGARIEGDTLILTKPVGRHVSYRGGGGESPRPVDIARIQIRSEAELQRVRDSFIDSLEPQEQVPGFGDLEFHTAQTNLTGSHPETAGGIGLPRNDPSLDRRSPLPDPGLPNLDLPESEQIPGFGEQEGLTARTNLTGSDPGAAGGIGLPRNDPSLDRRNPLPDPGLPNLDLPEGEQIPGFGDLEGLTRTTDLKDDPGS